MKNRILIEQTWKTIAFLICIISQIEITNNENCQNCIYPWIKGLNGVVSILDSKSSDRRITK